MENNERILRIHRYLSGEMDNRERTDFENEMNLDATLEKEVLVEKKLLAGIELVGDENIRNTIRKVEQELDRKHFFDSARVVSLPDKSNRNLMKKIIAIAAAAIVFLGIAWWGFFRESGPGNIDTNAVFSQYFKPDNQQVRDLLAAMESQGMAPAMNAQDSLREALAMYEEGKYNETCAALDTFLVYHPANDTAQFYLGMSHLNASRYGKAIDELNPVSVNDQSVFQLTSKWYLGLCYLQVENGLDKAREIFAELSNNAEYEDRQGASGS